MTSKEANRIQRTAKRQGHDVQIERDAWRQPQRVVIRMGAGR